MLNLNQVTDILNSRTYKSSDTIKQWRQVYYGISLHIKGAQPSYKVDGTNYKPVGYMGEEYQKLFDYYLFARHPRENPDTRNWRYSTYRPFQKDPFLRIISIVTGTVFQDSNYTIEMSNKADHEYIWGNNFDSSDIIRYFEKHFKSVVEDPNGLFIRVPKEPWNATTTPDVMPDVWFVNSKDIVLYEADDLVFKRGGFAWHVTTQAIFRYKQVEGQGGKKWVIADEGGYYTHGFGYLPVDKAGGNWNTEGYYESWFVGAKALADELVASKSAEQLVDKESSHPFIIEAERECDSCHGQRHMQEECDVDELHPTGVRLVDCSSCRGSGVNTSQNPGDRLRVPANLMKDDMLRIVVPPVEVNRNHREKNKEVMEALLDALNLLRTSEAQSGVAKALDQEGLHQFLSKISNDLFDRIIYNTCKDISAYRNITVVGDSTRPAILPYSIIKPTQFQIKTAQDLLTEYQSGVTAGMPIFVRQRHLLDYVDKQYSGDKTMRKKVEVMAQIDFLSAATSDEKTAMVLSGEAGQKDVQFSARLPLILSNLIEEKKADWFLKADIATIKAEAEAAFALMVPEPLKITQIKKEDVPAV